LQGPASVKPAALLEVADWLEEGGYTGSAAEPLPLAEASANRTCGRAVERGACARRRMALRRGASDAVDGDGGRRLRPTAWGVGCAVQNRPVSAESASFSTLSADCVRSCDPSRSRTSKRTKALITLPATGTKQLRVFADGRTVDVQGSQLYEDFPPYAARVYIAPPPGW